jgi:hypothetical protein
MRSAIAIAAFAAGAIAAPFNKREYVTDVEVVLHTEFVTVYATAADAAAATTAAYNPAGKHYGHGGNTWAAAPVATTTTAVYEAPAPAPTSSAEPTTSEAAPAWTAPPAPATTESSVYVAPTTSEAPVWVAPTTTSEAAPAWTAPATTEAAAPAAPAPTQESVQAPAAAAETPAAQAAAPSGGAPTSYSGLVVYQHNLHRANHSSPDLAWSDDLAASASIVAQSCNYAHNVDVNGGGYGQNIAAGVKPENIATIITDMFYNGEVGYFAGQYGKKNPDMDDFEKWGHFSQIVWAGTTHVGCATQDCSASGLSNTGGGVAPYFTVCNYKTPGKPNT